MQGVFAQPEQFNFKHIDISNGLSHPEIKIIYKDSRGFVWFGTAIGLNRFDGFTIKSYLNNPADSSSLNYNDVLNIFETPDQELGVLTHVGLTLYRYDGENFTRNLDSFCAKYGTSTRLKNIKRHTDGSYWFVEPDRLVHYSPKDHRQISIKNITGDNSSIDSDPIADVAIDRNGNCWVVHSNGIVEKIVIENFTGYVVERIFALYDLNEHKQTDYRIVADSDGDLWFVVPSLKLKGVQYYNVKDKKLQHISTTSAEVRLKSNSVSSMIEADDGKFWIATHHGGINVLDKKNMTCQYILHRDGDSRSLADNSVNCLYKDNQNIIWLGTYKRGVDLYHENIYPFDLYRHNFLDPGSLPFEDINRFAEDKNGNLWIGTNGGGLLYFNRQNGTFKQYKHDPGNENSLSGNIIVSLCVDSEENLWIGTYSTGLSKFDGKRFTRYTNVPGDSTTLPSQNIWEIFEDSKKRLWIGTLDAGVVLFDRKTGKCTRPGIGGSFGVQSLVIDAIAEDKKGNIWFGTLNGIDVLSADGKIFTHYASDSSSHSLSHHSVLDIMCDSKGRIWVGTVDGLNLFDSSINGFRTFRLNQTQKGILKILEDNLGDIWLSTLNGLSQMTMVDNDPSRASFKRYTELDGLQGRQFNLNAAFRTHNGELLFGGPTGFNIYRGKQRSDNSTISKIIFSELELYEKPVTIGEEVNGVLVLDKSISEVKEIVLPPNKNFFSIKFSALNYFNPERDQYLYMLEGLSSEWIPVDPKSHEIVFNGLNPGKYKLRVKAANMDGTWSLRDAKLSIVIQPPFWKTKMASLLYAVLVLLALLITRRFIQQREKLKFELEHERREIQRVNDLDMMKVKFFTNVSHEFRTPITLILTPIERLIKKTTDPEQVKQFQLIQRNGKRLMKLVNQLLDFKKLEVQEIKFNPAKGDIIDFIKETVLSFSDISENKNVQLRFNTMIEHLDTMFDQDKLEKILFNLLSNAFKFTLDNGTVSVNLDRVMDGNEPKLRIEVADTGIGIAEDKLDKIFEPFFQSELPKSIVNQGSGIGLAITKEFVKIHGGEISVVSEVGKGSCFRIILPLKEIIPEMADSNIAPTEELPNNAHEVDSITDTPNHDVDDKQPEKDRKSLLLVEDNDDFRFYLKDNLKFLYTIYEAADGKDGWNQVLANSPDLIVSDIMMPEMNGIELCSKIKSDERVSHIPVILLTARSSEEQRLEGIKSGADDYITKPFNFEILEARITNLLKRREKSQKTFRKTLEVKSSELQITPLDVKFIENAVKCVEQHVSSPDFSVEDLGVELGISRAYVFKKILALTGKTPLEFIRTIRLQHAAQLLVKSQLSVREVAYKVGFNNPKYFTKYFKEQFQVLPSDYADHIKNSST